MSDEEADLVAFLETLTAEVAGRSRVPLGFRRNRRGVPALADLSPSARNEIAHFKFCKFDRVSLGPPSSDVFVTALPISLPMLSSPRNL
jgi:hypothetical protein